MKNCLCCNNIITHKSKIYCNNYCQKIYESDLKIKRWIEFGERIGKGPAKRWLRKVYGDVCAICGITEWMGKNINLEIDHIDGNAYNNLPSNLRLLCPNCHSQTITYKNRNSGKGRKSRYTEEGWLLEWCPNRSQSIKGDASVL